MRKNNVIILITALGIVASCNSQEWVPLIPESGLEGWIQRGGNASFHNSDGIIIGTTVPEQPNSFLCTRKEYADFVLEYEVMIDNLLNSGVQIRSLSVPDFEDGRVHGYQIEIDPSDRAWSGGIYDEGRRGWLVDLEGKPEAQKAFKKGEWNRFRVEASGDLIRTWVNDVPVAELNDDMTLKGFIALQVHSTESLRPMNVQWRNIRIQELD